jgi:predicted nucleic acid-binding protein
VTLVIDASLTLSWYFEDERTPAADALLDQVTNTGAVVPSLWRLETANGLQVAIRRKRIDAAFRDRALTHLTRLPITVDPETDAYAWTTTLQLADRFQLTWRAGAPGAAPAPDRPRHRALDSALRPPPMRWG